MPDALITVFRAALRRNGLDSIERINLMYNGAARDSKKQAQFIDERRARRYIFDGGNSPTPEDSM
ncbi:MAG: hypothetical protein HYR55_08685 [Acidobacteria bacterium]|nr:hypothetical protein [Acidobacteriota bacterium]MBI3656469.1 hypothetical protein [Acidobacteriota bacterium]